VLVEAVEAQQSLASARSLELHLQIPPHLPEVWADRHRLSQCLENLIGNALKFTGAGGVITISARPRDGEVVFSVRDTGVGIASDHLPRLFDPFWQASHGQHHGAGLGLPIVKGIIEAHGGQIWVNSTLGEGSEFCFTLPQLCQAEASPPSEHARPS
jgi:signal transduction histidine kinase